MRRVKGVVAGNRIDADEVSEVGRGTGLDQLDVAEMEILEILESLGAGRWDSYNNGQGWRSGEAQLFVVCN